MKEILLVEDDGLYSKLLSYILENSGFVVDCATNGAEALDMIDTKKYDLIITDLLMPQTNGLELLKQLRAKKNNYSTKVIVMSVVNDGQYWEDSLSQGADECLKKPVTAKQLVQAVRRLLFTQAA